MNSPAVHPPSRFARTLPRLSEPQRRRLLLLAAGATALAFAWWMYQRWTHVYTNDARIASQLIEVSTRAAGQVVDFRARQGDRLSAGDLIAQIDDRAARLMLEELEATRAGLASAHTRIEAQIEMVDRETGGKLRAARSQLDAALASSASAESELQYKQAEWERAQSLRDRQIISQQQWETVRNAWQQSQQQLQRTRAEAERARAMVAEAEASQAQIQVLASELRGIEHEDERLGASIARQEVAIDELRVTAPVAGVVDQTFVHAGEYVVPGQRLLLVHDPDKVWIDANVKETEIRHLAVGEPAEIRVDAYPDRRFEGKVVRIGSAATSQFSLLPQGNAGGNFTKVTQRLPVKISIEQSDGELRPGMMVEVAIEVR